MIAFVRMLLELFGRIAVIFQQKQLLDGGKAESTAQTQKDILDAVYAAQGARTQQEQRDTADVARLDVAGGSAPVSLPDDGFRRD